MTNFITFFRFKKNMSIYYIDYCNQNVGEYVRLLEKYLNLDFVVNDIEKKLKRSYRFINSPLIRNNAHLTNNDIAELAIIEKGSKTYTDIHNDELEILENIKVFKMKQKCVENYNKNPLHYQKFKYYSFDIISCNDNSRFQDNALNFSNSLKFPQKLKNNSSDNITKIKDLPLHSSDLSTHDLRKTIFTIIAQKEIYKNYKVLKINKDINMQFLKKVAKSCCEQICF
ncbi:uncharacterized protein LOC135928255 isoform X2 [Gordionus sp. m RMFG-2023]|uniref:uncharacterized protein LOC135928255 isoform X2 n=1 Tax=Gordionus sp. m RMFG-2023 TaxID=3053472 RepID=UPI0031FBB1EB